MRKWVKELGKLANEIIYIYLNYIIANIPIWGIRCLLYKSLGMKIGHGSRILMKTVVISPWKISIGEETCINERCFLDGRGRIQIGSNVSIAVYSKLITGYHDIDNETFSYEKDEINIADNVAIMADCIVLAGAKIRRGAVFTAGTIVKRGDYVENGIYSGNPAKYIRQRKSEPEYNLKWHPLLR